MADLRAAAEWMLDRAKQRRNDIQFFVGMEQIQRRIAAEADYYLLAAQALEALAWMEEVDLKVQRMTKGWYICAVDGGGNYCHDTPLAAILAAMEGEKDAKCGWRVRDGK